MGTTEEKRENDDMVLVHGVDPKRQELHVLRHRDDAVEAGVVRPIEDGKPALGDIVRLKPRPEFPLACDVETLVKHPDPPKLRTRPGPPMVVSEAYRRGWDQVFGAPNESEMN